MRLMSEQWRPGKACMTQPMRGAWTDKCSVLLLTPRLARAVDSTCWGGVSDVGSAVLTGRVVDGAAGHCVRVTRQPCVEQAHSR